MRTLAFASRPASNPNLVKFDRVNASDLVSVHADHARSELVQKLESCFVSLDSELALKLHGRHARRQTGDEVGTPEPRQEVGVAVLYDRAGGEPSFLLAGSATKDVRSRGDPDRIRLVLAVRAGPAIRPSHLLQILGTRIVATEQPLEV
jgi:hypothetical protein